MPNINDENYTRLEINPLIEENMYQQSDGEFSVSQVTGNVTLRREDKYISKTKELNESMIESEFYLKDINDKIDNINEKNNLADRIEEIEDLLEETKNLIEEMYKKLEEYEQLSKDMDEDMNELDDYIHNSMLPTLSDLVSQTMSTNIDLLGPLLIQWELLDIIIDNEEYFNNFVKETFKYVDASGNIKDYGVIAQHEDNKKELDLRIYKSDYQTYINDLIGRYNAAKSKYGLSGSYTITGWS